MAMQKNIEKIMLYKALIIRVKEKYLKISKKIMKK